MDNLMLCVLGLYALAYLLGIAAITTALGEIRKVLQRIDATLAAVARRIEKTAPREAR